MPSEVIVQNRNTSCGVNKVDTRPRSASLDEVVFHDTSCGLKGSGICPHLNAVYRAVDDVVADYSVWGGHPRRIRTAHLNGPLLIAVHRESVHCHTCTSDGNRAVEDRLRPRSS